MMSNLTKIILISIKRIGVIDTIKELPFIIHLAQQMNKCDKAFRRLTEHEHN